MPDDLDMPEARDTSDPADLVRRLAEMIRRRDEAQKVAAASRGEIERLVRALRQQHPALVALLTEKGSSPELDRGLTATSPEVDWTRLPQNSRDREPC